ncbi:glucose-methanol-choline oxidoreductase [Neokomagataea thailandica NBRC 106555]|uniref:GMC family oxidoreductase n=2 Tax=Neokomagataea TaxID=1223423 RepID=A0A4Y6V3D6_9PROT|nr:MULTISPECIES: GMC family oxidoreductase [Neokomagataea]QDH24569.1 GMC family oxidoreductase [Neokomagataea tanensis]GBR52413.1 glucose-methanol-choline oxidoreductase [Neokomagataea thailandica NBRC 106555]
MAETEIEQTEVVIVGAGPSGAIMAHTLAKAGIKVTCLEQGDWISPADYAANFDMWELVARGHWATEANSRANPADYPLELSETDLPPSMYSAVGGSTIHFGALWPRLTVSDFRVKTIDNIADDWPITYHDLVPYFDEVDNFIGVSGLEGDPAYPDGLAPPQPAHPLGKAGMRTAQALNQLGWHWWPGANAIPTQKNGELAACVRYGTCVQGCPQGAKASFDLAYWPAAIAAGAKLITGARVSEITTDENGLANGVNYFFKGQKKHLKSNYVVMCANGIGTPRLLLLSKSDKHPNGLANSSGLVGKNLMLHPNCCALGYYEDDLETWRGPLGAVISSMEFYETKEENGFVRGAKLHASTAPGLILNGIDPHRLLPFDELWGEAFHGVVKDATSAILWAANIEDLPEESNCVTLDDTLVDGDGIPCPKVNYRFSENTLKIREFTLQKMVDAHKMAGAKKVIPVLEMPGEPGHLLGTTRMGNDPNASVVDSMGRAHDVPNLLIADGSIFVTSGSANPTSTICALALRIGRNLVDVIQNQKT